MAQHVVPIACKPWALNGISGRLIVRHYEDDYGAAVRSLNALRDRGFDAKFVRGGFSAWYAAGGRVR